MYRLTPEVQITYDEFMMSELKYTEKMWHLIVTFKKAGDTFECVYQCPSEREAQKQRLSILEWRRNHMFRDYESHQQKEEPEEQEISSDADTDILESDLES